MRIIRLQGAVERRHGIYYEYDADSTPLGEGGMGRVFKGYRVIERTGVHHPVAIKVVYEDAPMHVVERAKRESSIQIDNDNLIKMYGFVESKVSLSNDEIPKTQYHIIMELLVGIALEDVLKGVTTSLDGVLVPFAAELYNQYQQNRDEFVVRVLKAILSGLMALHDNGYIHRDIDPSNIMITLDSKIKLIDFGICKQVVSLGSIDKSLTSSGVFMGKVNYAAPELVLGDVKNQNYTTDIYAVGVLMYQLCSGHMPFVGTDQEVLTSHLRKTLPIKVIRNTQFRSIIQKATAKKQSNRYSSAAEFRVAIERVKPTPEVPKLKIVVFSVVFLLLVVGGGLMLLNKQEENEPVVIPPDCEKLYENSITLLSEIDSVHKYYQGKELLRVLAEDSLYLPAQVQYYVMLLNSSSEFEIKRGFQGITQLYHKGVDDFSVFFELGVTLSKGNKHFDIPRYRQSIMDIDYNLVAANEALYKAMAVDTMDYRVPYWILCNLMDCKLQGGLSTKEDRLIDREIISMYFKFKQLIRRHEDQVSDKYRLAISGYEKALKAWGLI